MRDTLELEKQGIPSVYIITAAFRPDAIKHARDLGIPSMRFAEISLPRPFDSLEDDKAARERAEIVAKDTIAALTVEIPPAVVGPGKVEKKFITVEGKDVGELIENVGRLFHKNQWSDGNPIIPPTKERVEWMLTGTDRPRGDVVGVFPPRKGIATVEVIAINAVMAGCLPSYMPVLITAVEAMAGPKSTYDLLGIQATTNRAYPPSHCKWADT